MPDDDPDQPVTGLLRASHTGDAGAAERLQSPCEMRRREAAAC